MNYSSKKLNPDSSISITVFWILFSLFLIMFFMFLLSSVFPPFRGYSRFLFLFVYSIFLMLGITLIVLTLKEKIKGALKIFLIITGSSTIATILGIFIHNLISAVMGDYFFFAIGNFVAPICFIAGSIGCMVNLSKIKGKKK